MNKTLKHGLITAGLILITIFIVKRCEGEPRVVTKTEYITKTDTIVNVKIRDTFKIRYVERIKTVKGEDSIVFVEKPADTVLIQPIEAREYETALIADSSRADLKILTTGELLGVTGTITRIEKQTTTKIFKPKSGLFLSAETSIQPVFENIGLNLDYQLRNQLLIGIGANYDNRIKEVTVMGRIGIRIF